MTKKQDPSTVGYADGKYVLPPLPYAYDALEPMLDEKTVRIHHDKHHAAYVAGANAAAEKLREIADGKLDASATTNWVRTLSFNVSGHVLHTIYWTNMTPDPKTRTSGRIILKISAASSTGTTWNAATRKPWRPDRFRQTLIFLFLQRHGPSKVRAVFWRTSTRLLHPAEQ